jgi:putative spermidine/putrescine transport system ATP-binding protein
MELERTPVTIHACAKTYPDGTRGLRPTDLRIEPGEVLALLGPSGCGKTTLLRIIAGLEIPDEGARIFFGGEDVTQVPVERRGIGMVFQNYALFPQMSVAANIGYGLRIRGMPESEIRRRVGELIDLVRLNGLEHRRPSELSGGQRQRVALARAIAVRPRVLLLDEPLTALDAKLKESLREELAELLRRLRITAIHVTHDQHEAMSIADRMAVMQSGEVIQIGTAEELYRTPRHPFVATFLGRVNALDLIERSDGERGVRIGGAWLPCDGTRSSAQALLRPEDIRVMPTNDATEQTSSARVSHRAFLGDRVHLRVATDDAGELLVDAARDCPLNVGDRVRLAIDPGALMMCGEPQ